MGAAAAVEPEYRCALLKILDICILKNVHVLGFHCCVMTRTSGGYVEQGGLGVAKYYPMVILII